MTCRELRLTLCNPAYADDSLVLVAVFRGDRGDVCEVLDLETNGPHLQLNVTLEPHVKRLYM